MMIYLNNEINTQQTIPSFVNNKKRIYLNIFNCLDMFVQCHEIDGWIDKLVDIKVIPQPFIDNLYIKFGWLKNY